MLKLLSEPLPPRCPTANAAGQLLVQTLRFEAICDLLVGGKRPYTSSVLSSRHIWQGLDPQRPAKQLGGDGDSDGRWGRSQVRVSRTLSGVSPV